MKHFTSIICFTFFMLNVYSQGPILIHGLDTESDHYGTSSAWCSIIQTGLLNKIHNGKTDILVICGADFVKTYWNQTGTCLGRQVHYIRRKKKIKKVHFEDYALVVIPTTDQAGVTEKQLEALHDRKDAIYDFICAGGGLLASMDESDNPYRYLEKFGDVSVTPQEYDDITPTQEGITLGITNDNLDYQHHIIFDSYPSFFNILANNTNGSVTALGGAYVGDAKANFTIPKTSFCKNESIVINGSSSQNAQNYFLAIQESDAGGSVFGNEIMQHFTGAPSSINISDFANSHNFAMACGRYYRVKLAISGDCTRWDEKSQIIYISCPPLDIAPLECCTHYPIFVPLDVINPNQSFNYSWSPSQGIANPNIPNAVFNKTIINNYPRVFTVTVADPTTGCTQTKSVTLFCTTPEIKIEGKLVGVCQTELSFTGSGAESVNWSNGSNANSIVVQNNGTYSVSAQNACGTSSATVNVWGSSNGPLNISLLPNVFTPNNDGYNDYYCFQESGASSYEITIFNQWGNQVYFNTGNASGGFSTICTWDGGNSSDGVYYVVLKIFDNCGGKLEKSGYLHLFR